MSIFSGISGLFQSRKGTLSMLIIAISSVALFWGKLDGTSFVATLGVVQAIFVYCQHKIDLQSPVGHQDISTVQVNASTSNLPAKGQL